MFYSSISTADMFCVLRFLLSFAYIESKYLLVGLVMTEGGKFQKIWRRVPNYIPKSGTFPRVVPSKVK